MAASTLGQALAFIEQHGVVMVSARGPAPRLTEAIAGEPVAGSWWGHAKGKLIFNILGQVNDSDQVLACRLAGGKLTLVHRRLWPALVRIAARFDSARLARVSEQHTASGRHVSTQTAFPLWVPEEVQMLAATVPEEQALAAFAAFIETPERRH